MSTVVMMRGPPGEPSTMRSLPSSSTMVGVMADSGRLPGAMALFGPWMRPYILGVPCFGGEVVHLVVEQEAEAGGGDVRAEAVVERGGDGDGVALAVEHGVVRGVRGFRFGDGGRWAAAAGNRRDAVRSLRRGVVEHDAFAPGIGVGGIEQRGLRDFCEVGVAEIVGAVHVGAAHGLGDELDFWCAAVAEFGEVIGPQDVEHLDQRDASRGGRRRAEDLVTVIGAVDRDALLDLVVGEVGFGDEAAVGLPCQRRASSRSRRGRSRRDRRRCA